MISATTLQDKRNCKRTTRDLERKKRISREQDHIFAWNLTLKVAKICSTRKYLAANGVEAIDRAAAWSCRCTLHFSREVQVYKPSHAFPIVN